MIPQLRVSCHEKHALWGDFKLNGGQIISIYSLSINITWACTSKKSGVYTVNPIDVFVIQLEGCLYQQQDRIKEWRNYLYTPLLKDVVTEFPSLVQTICEIIIFNVPVEIVGGEDYLFMDSTNTKMIAKPGYVFAYMLWDDNKHNIMVYENKWGIHKDILKRK